jgi:hypothetical protein
VHPVAGQVVRLAARDHLHEHRVVERGDHRPGMPHPAVQSNPKPARRPIRQQTAVVRGELVLRVLRGDAALDGKAVARNFRLIRHPHFR